MKNSKDLGKLTDSYQRRIRKLRVSLNETCNFRCTYCMPENMRFKGGTPLLSPQRIFEICQILTNQGVSQIRVTGGEPLLRPDFDQIIKLLSKLDLEKFGLTTNGFYLAEKLESLKQLGCTGVNVSLDSLNPKTFAKITRRDVFSDVLSAVFKAKEMNFNLKLNMIVMRGVNHDEICDFAEFSKKYGIPVRYLELMQIGEARKNHGHDFVAADEILDSLRHSYQLMPVTVDHDSTSFDFKTPDGAHLGLIASETKPFCGNCSRWRLTSTGHLRACLMSEKGVDVSGANEEEILGLFPQLLALKPSGRIKEISQNMNEIGG